MAHVELPASGFGPTQPLAIVGINRMTQHVGALSFSLFLCLVFQRKKERNYFKWKNAVWFYSQAVRRVVKFTEGEIKLWVARGWGREGKAESVFTGYRVSI